MVRSAVLIALAAFFLSAALPQTVRADNTLNWDTNRNRIDASIQSWPLPKLLEEIASATGWQVFVDPNASHSVTAKFKDLDPGEGLRLMLGSINYAIVPQSNAPPRLFVYLKSVGDATRLIQPANQRAGESGVRKVPNELIVTLKPGSNLDIDELARLLGAKITGRIDDLGIYRLQFEDEEATKAARSQLAANDDVKGVEDNFYMERPPDAQPVLSSGATPFRLVPTAHADGKHIIALIDTPIQLQGHRLDAFLLPAISVAGQAAPNPNSPTHGDGMLETLARSLSITGDGQTSWQVLPVDVYGNSAYANMFDVAMGVYAAVNDGGATIVSMAMGSVAGSSMLQTVTQSAHSQGVVFLGAAGNQPVSTPTYPAAYPWFIATTSGKPNGELASYANNGSFVDIVAPGNSIISFNGQTYYVSGTSVSTSIAAGIVAGTADKTGLPLSQVEATVRNDLAYRPSVSK